MSRRSTIHVARNLERNLVDLERFFPDQDAQGSFEGLLHLLFDVVIPTLERFPEIGIDLLARGPRSVQASARIERLRERLGAASAREHIAGDYLFLYAVRGHELWLLAVRHHRQLSYDLKAHWVRR